VLTLPPIKLKAYKVLGRGDAFPEIAAITLDGKPMTLADHHGKYVLLILWASLFPNGTTETDHLKAIYSAFSADDRLVMMGVSADPSPGATRAYVEKNNMAWPQGIINRDATSMGMWTSLGVNGIPDIFLIGPDGKLIARDLRGDGIMSAVNAALKPAP
jgi:peroxiredoxin